MADRSEARAVVAAPAPDLGETDRRDSRRVAVTLLVRDVALGGSFEARDGNVSLGGLYFEALHPPVGNRLEVRLLLPGVRREIHAVGEVLRISRNGPRFGTHLRFADILLDDELAIARFLQER